MRGGVLALLTGTVVGKIIGLLRELLLAALFGTSSVTAAYRIAQTAVLVPVNFVSADALSAGFLPNHSKALRREREFADALYSVVQRSLAVVSFAIAAALLIWRNWWAQALAPGVDQETWELAGGMIAILALSVPFYLSTNVTAYLEMSHGKHLLMASRPTVQSIGLIAGTIAAFVTGVPAYLAIGFTASYVLLSLFGMLRVRQLGIGVLTPRSRLRALRLPAARMVWRSMRPLVAVPLLVQGAWVVERIVASLISTSSVAATDFARFITDTALAMIGVPVGAVALAFYATKSHEELRQHLDRVAGAVLLLAMPVSGVLLCGGVPIVMLLFERGAFDRESTEATAAFLAGLSVGLWAQCLAYVQLKALSSQNRNRVVGAALAAGALVSITTSFALYEPLGLFGLGLAASLGSMTQLLVATISLSATRSVFRSLLLHLPAAIAFVTLAVGFNESSPEQQAITAALGLGTYVLWILAVRPLRLAAFDLARVIVNRTGRGTAS